MSYAVMFAPHLHGNGSTGSSFNASSVVLSTLALANDLYVIPEAPAGPHVVKLPSAGTTSRNKQGSAHSVITNAIKDLLTTSLLYSHLAMDTYAG